MFIFVLTIPLNLPLTRLCQGSGHSHTREHLIGPNKYSAGWVIKTLGLFSYKIKTANIKCIYLIKIRFVRFSSQFLTPRPHFVKDDFLMFTSGTSVQARLYGGAKHPQTKSKTPSVKAVLMVFYCRFGKPSALWFALWRSISISTCFCRVEQCSQSQTYLLISWKRRLGKNPLTAQIAGVFVQVVFSANHLIITKSWCNVNKRLIVQRRELYW